MPRHTTYGHSGENTMKPCCRILLLAMVGLTASLAQVKPPVKLVFPAKNGSVTFDHAAHVKLEKNNCKTCHPALFPQDAKTPLGFKPPHKNEEDKKISCGACHRPGGSAFETKGHCTKCHVRAPAAKK